MTPLPEGTVTFLFTDIEGSTRLLAHLGESAYSSVHTRHQELIRAAVAAHQGAEVSTEGDSFFIAFASASQAVAAALDAQIALATCAWPKEGGVSVRMGLHTGPARLLGSTYLGLTVNQAARVASAANGGQVLASEAAVSAAVVPDLASWSDLGRHRLKDLQGSLELYELCHPALSAQRLPVRSLDRVTHNLPIQASSFLGRAEDLDRGAQLMAGHRVVTVTGPGGTGKTRLSYQVAATAAAEFPDGVWVAELSVAREPEHVETFLLEALGLREEPGRSRTDTLVEHLRERRALVLLDNCEHLVDSVAALISRLCRECPHVSVWCTSREALRVAGEHVWRLQPMVAQDAVELFCARAAEASFGFTLSEENAPYVADICARLDRIPLALELAAARVGTLSPQQLAERLGASLDLLSKGWRGAEQRQSSLRAAIAWSYDLLNPHEQALLRRLSVSVGTFSLELAEALCPEGPESALDLLDALVSKSFVISMEGQATRFSLLVTLRTFAHEKLVKSGEEADTQLRYFGFYSNWLTARSAYDPDALDADYANLLPVLEHHATAGTTRQHGLFLNRLSAYWFRRGHWRVSKREHERYLVREDRDRDLEGLAAGALAEIELLLGDAGRAEELYRLALQCAEDCSNLGLQASWLMGLGNVAAACGDFVTAMAHMQQGMRLVGEEGDVDAEARFAANMGGIALAMGDAAEGYRRYSYGLRISRQLNDRYVESYCLGNLGQAAFELGRLDEAKNAELEALTIAREIVDRSSESQWLGNLSTIELAAGNTDVAAECAEQALAISRELGDRAQESQWLGALGDVAVEHDDLVTAEQSYAAALDLARGIGDRRSQATWWCSLGSVALARGTLDTAREQAATGLALAVELGVRSERLLRQGVAVLAALDPSDPATAATAVTATWDERASLVLAGLQPEGDAPIRLLPD